MQRAEAAAALIRKSIARHYGKQDHCKAWGQRMALARAILAECKPTIEAREAAEAYLYRELGARRRRKQ